MKIGAGGLQSLACQEIVPPRKMDPANALRREDIFPQGAPSMEGENGRENLVKAVGRLNQAAEAYNQPLEFLVREDEEGKPLVELVEKESRAVRAQVLPEVVAAAAQEPMKTIGLILDMYL